MLSYQPRSLRTLLARSQAVRPSLLLNNRPQPTSISFVNSAHRRMVLLRWELSSLEQLIENMLILISHLYKHTLQVAASQCIHVLLILSNGFDSK